MTCGIYMWENKINHHKYIGYSKNIERRWKEHSSLPFSSKKTDDQNKAFYNAIRKYGVDLFQKIILEECPEEKLKERECYYIAQYNTFKNKEDYNETPGGDGISPNARLAGEAHGMHVLELKDVIFCRQKRLEGYSGKQVWDTYFKEKYENKISISGFFNMYGGRTWKDVMPEVFNKNIHVPHGKVTAKDRDEITKRFYSSGLNRHQFAISKECYVGEATLYNILDNPTFYDGK